MYPAIISRETFDKVQERLEKIRYFTKNNVPRIPFFMTGKLYCGHYGTFMTADGGTARARWGRRTGIISAKPRAKVSAINGSRIKIRWNLMLPK
jgi:hypothetical protein